MSLFGIAEPCARSAGRQAEHNIIVLNYAEKVGNCEMRDAPGQKGYYLATYLVQLGERPSYYLAKIKLLRR